MTGAESDAWFDQRELHDVTVAVIDTGLAWNHPDLAPESLWVNSGEVPANGIDDDGNGYRDDVVGYDLVGGQHIPWDFDGHGTHVAGVIAARTDNGEGIAGICPSARIMVLRALDNFGNSLASRVAEAIVYAADNGARVINVSIGGSRPTLVERLAIDHAFRRGAVVVIAAGNDGADLAGYGPAGAPNALTVGATNHEDQLLGFSNRGPDMVAPGIDILSLRAHGTDLAAGISGYPAQYRVGDGFVGAHNRYYSATGTSFAAPLVAGTAALLFARNPSLDNAQVMRMIKQSATDVSAPGVDEFSGYGRLDAAAALGADPDFYVDAQLNRFEVVQEGNSIYLHLIGTASADRFAGATVEYGAGEDPTQWVKASGDIDQQIFDDVLAQIDATTLAGSPSWTFRVVSEHQNGRRREARLRLELAQ